MGTREVYEEKLRSGNLYHEPTMAPGLGSARCPRCLSPVNPNSGQGEWTITPSLHGATAVVGTGSGALMGMVHGYNKGLPYIQKQVKGPKWLQMLVGLPPLFLFSGATGTFGGYAVPTFAQLSVTSYYAASSASHYIISQPTKYIEETFVSRQTHGKTT